ncbi:MAG: TerB family tellurite resistance protein [Caldilineaceae bacterium]|nr:TerB family tellurite resistance protein [Caldilineaceae bacterium]
MATGNLIVALAKVLIAAAWADGELTTEEVNIMKDLLFRLPRVGNDSNMTYTAVQWAEVEMYIDAPVDQSERARLITELQAEMHSPEDKALVLHALHDVVRADGVISTEDKAVVDEIENAINAVDFGLFGQFSRLLQGPRNRRSAAMDKAPNRELYFDDFIYNKVYYGVRRRLDLGEGVPLQIDQTRLRQLSAVGGLMARVAEVDLNVTDEEFAKMVELLQEYWGLNHQEAVFVAEVAVSEVSPSMDMLRLVRELYSSVQPEQVSLFLDLLFAVAAADGFVSTEEADVIYEISRSLGLAHKAFIDAKLKVPAELRAS